MADFPRKQILPETFYAEGYRKTWHYVRAVYFPKNGDNEMPLEERNTRRSEINDFIRVEAEGRFYVDRTSKPGYWLESPRDAMLYKLRFL